MKFVDDERMLIYLQKASERVISNDSEPSVELFLQPLLPIGYMLLRANKSCSRTQ